MRCLMSCLPKKKCFLYLFFALIYSGNGLVTALVMDYAGRLNPNEPGQIIIFVVGGCLLFLVIYLAMYIDNVLLRQIIKTFNLNMSRLNLRQFASRQQDQSAQACLSFQTQDLPLFWQEYLLPLLIYPIWGLTLFVSMIYLFLKNIPLALAFILGSWLMTVPQFIFSRRLEQAGEALSQAKEIQLASLNDFTAGLPTIRQHQATEPFLAQILLKITAMEDAQVHFYTSHNLVMFWTGPLKALGLLLPLAGGLLTMEETGLNLANLLAMMTAVTSMIHPWHQILDATASLQSAKSLRKKMLAKIKKGVPKEKKTPVKSHQLPLSIVFKNASKAYPKQVILQKANWLVPAQSHTLLTGASGSGKSTLFRMLLDEEKLDMGTLELRDQKGQIYPPNCQQVSMIAQNPYCFKLDLRSNLTLFQKFSDDRLIAVLKQVELWEELGEDLACPLHCHQLSGGQRMKLEIARSLLRKKTNPPR